MTGPRLRALKRALQDLANPFALAIGEAVQELGGPSLDDDLRRTVAEAEAEGAALIGAKPCPTPHGFETETGEIAARFEARLGGPCPTCGAAV